MDFGLLEVFSALALGMMCFLLASNLIWIVKGSTDAFTIWLPKQWWWPEKDSITLMAIGLVFAYATGLYIQDVSDKWTDSSHHERNFEIVDPRCWSKKFLKTEDEHRFETLFEEEDDKKALKANGLGREVLTAGKRSAFKDVLRRDGKGIPLSVKGQKEKYFVEKTALMDSCSVFYYEAKNWCYLQPTYFSELRRIQQRIDFSRSSFMLLSLYLYGFVAVLLWHLVSTHIGGRLTKGGSEAEGTNADQQSKLTWNAVFGRAFYRLVTTLCMVIVLSFGCVWGFHHAENVFNERAFGYYVSHIRSTENPAVCPSCQRKSAMPQAAARIPNAQERKQPKEHAEFAHSLSVESDSQ